MADGISHRQHGKAERERHAYKTDTKFWKGRCQNGASTTAEN